MLKLAVVAMLTAISIAMLGILDILPQSPFQQINLQLSDTQLIRMLNWIIPLEFYFAVTTAWLSAVAVVLPVKFIMRKLNMIK